MTKATADEPDPEPKGAGDLTLRSSWASTTCSNPSGSVAQAGCFQPVQLDQAVAPVGPRDNIVIHQRQRPVVARHGSWRVATVVEQPALVDSGVSVLRVEREDHAEAINGFIELAKFLQRVAEVEPW